MTTLTGLEENLFPMTSFGAIPVTDLDTPPVHALPPPLKFLQKEKGNPRALVVKESLALEIEKVKTFPQDHSE
jgi:hypothetical protein